MTSSRLNRIATLAAIPLLAFGAVLATRANHGSETPSSSPYDGGGILVVAGLVSQDLTVWDFRRPNAPMTLSLPGPPHEMAFAGGRLYVTLGRANRLAEIDPAAPAVLRVVDLPGNPHGIAVSSGELMVGLDDANEIVTLDLGSLQVIRRVPSGDTPHTLATERGVLFTTDSRDGNVRRIDAEGSVTANAGELPEAIALRDGIALAADAEGGMLYAFDAATLAPLRSVRLPGRPVRLVVTPDSVLASRNQDAALAVLDFPSLKPVATVPVGLFPDGICQSPDGRWVAIASNGTNRVTIVDTATWKPVGLLAAGHGPGSCAWLSAD